MASNPAPTLSESVYQRLRADIIAGRLQPGARLRIEELRQAYDTSASPLREALSRLAGEGFVIAAGQRGFTVAPIAVKDLDEITALRILLECEAITSSLAHGDDAWEGNLVAAFHHLGKINYGDPDNVDEIERLNEDFHDALIAACDSSWLLRIRQTLFEQHRRYRMISIMVEDDSRDLHQEHTDIFAAALARDAVAARAATEIHIQRTAELTRAALEHHAAGAD